MLRTLLGVPPDAGARRLDPRARLACRAVPLPAPARASVTPVETYPTKAINTGDTAWMLTSSALVLMMTGPGLALFY